MAKIQEQQGVMSPLFFLWSCFDYNEFSPFISSVDNKVSLNFDYSLYINDTI